MKTVPNWICELDRPLSNEIIEKLAEEKVENVNVKTLSKDDTFSPYTITKELKDIKNNHINFPEDLPEESKLYLISLSFLKTSEECVKTRMFYYANYEMIAISACVNYIIATELSFKYILKKFKIKYQNNNTLQQLYSLLPIQIKTYFQEYHFFNIEMFLTIYGSDKIKNYFDNSNIAFEHMRLFLRFAPKLKNILFSIKQNNLYL